MCMAKWRPILSSEREGVLHWEAGKYQTKENLKCSQGPQRSVWHQDELADSPGKEILQINCKTYCGRQGEQFRNSEKMERPKLEAVTSKGRPDTKTDWPTDRRSLVKGYQTEKTQGMVWWTAECFVRCGVCTAVTVMNAVFRDVAPCGSCKNRRFGGSWPLHHRGDKNQWTRNNFSCN
jgi:hypothetical protein